MTRWPCHVGLAALWGIVLSVQETWESWLEGFAAHQSCPDHTHRGQEAAVPVAVSHSFFLSGCGWTSIPQTVPPPLPHFLGTPCGCLASAFLIESFWGFCRVHHFTPLLLPELSHAPEAVEADLGPDIKPTPVVPISSKKRLSARLLGCHGDDRQGARDCQLIWQKSTIQVLGRGGGVLGRGSCAPAHCSWSLLLSYGPENPSPPVPTHSLKLLLRRDPPPKPKSWQSRAGSAAWALAQ